MTIDRAIKREQAKAEEYRAMSSEGNAEIAEINIRCSKYHEQLAEWLELLKWYQQGMEDIPSESGVLPKDVYRAGYIKAIQDFAERLKKFIDANVILKVTEVETGQALMELLDFGIDEIAEQLKEGSADNE